MLTWGWPGARDEILAMLSMKLEGISWVSKSHPMFFWENILELIMVHIKVYLVRWPATVESQTSHKISLGCDFISSDGSTEP